MSLKDNTQKGIVKVTLPAPVYRADIEVTQYTGEQIIGWDEYYEIADVLKMLDDAGVKYD